MRSKKIIKYLAFICLNVTLCSTDSISQNNIGADSTYSFENVFTFTGEDTSVAFRMQLELINGIPTTYTSWIVTPVCADSVCQLANLRVFWDLTGNYSRFDTIPDFPLTKYNHEKFTTDDYLKLHRILSDKYSVLSRYKRFEIQSKKNSDQDIDGHSGATQPSISDVVVNGALYTCHTLWHIVHGQVKTKIWEHTNALYNNKLKEKMLTSGIKRYELFAIEKLTKTDYEKYFGSILHVLEKGTPAGRLQVLKTMPEQIRSNKKVREKLKKAYEHFDGYSKLYYQNNYLK